MEEQSHTTAQSLNQKHIQPRVTDSPNPPSDNRVKVTFVARPLRKPVAPELWQWAHGVAHSRAEGVFILENYFASKSLTGVRESFSCAYSEKTVPN
jgi:hypothetical protein